jgi:hypothetical protein
VEFSICNFEQMQGILRLYYLYCAARLRLSMIREHPLLPAHYHGDSINTIGKELSHINDCERVKSLLEQVFNYVYTMSNEHFTVANHSSRLRSFTSPLPISSSSIYGFIVNLCPRTSVGIVSHQQPHLYRHLPATTLVSTTNKWVI